MLNKVDGMKDLLRRTLPGSEEGSGLVLAITVKAEADEAYAGEKSDCAENKCKDAVGEAEEHQVAREHQKYGPRAPVMPLCPTLHFAADAMPVI